MSLPLPRTQLPPPRPDLQLLRSSLRTKRTQQHHGFHCSEVSVCAVMHKLRMLTSSPRWQPIDLTLSYWCNMSVEGHGVGGRSEEEVASALQRKLQLGEAKLDEEEQAAQAADKQPNNSSDDSTTQTPSKLSSASSTGSLKKLSAKAKGECVHPA